VEPLVQIGIAGFGGLGQAVAAGLARGVPGAEIAAITSRDLDKAAIRRRLRSAGCPPLCLSSKTGRANPRTGVLTAMSILATIRKLASPLHAGS
jgi:predicted dinucleotide-utilizing enzyme